MSLHVSSKAFSGLGTHVIVKLDWRMKAYILLGRWVMYCSLAISSRRMVFAVVLSLFGYVVIIPLSWGNSPSNRTPLRMLGPIVIACAYAV